MNEDTAYVCDICGGRWDPGQVMGMLVPAYWIFLGYRGDDGMSRHRLFDSLFCFEKGLSLFREEKKKDGR